MNKEVSMRKEQTLGAILSTQIRYAWSSSIRDILNQPWTSMMTLVIIAISLTLPTTCYVIWKNVHQTALLWYPTPQFTVYLNKSLDDAATKNIVEQVQSLPNVASVDYLTRTEALEEFRNWSGFNDALKLLNENPLPAVMIVTPNATQATNLEQLHQQLMQIHGIDQIKTDSNWFTRFSVLTGLIAKIVIVLTLLMIAIVFLVISNGVRLTIFSRREAIKVMKLIGATDGFILRPFLYSGLLQGFLGALLSLLLVKLLSSQLNNLVITTTHVFNITYSFQSTSLQEGILIMLLSSILGWLAAWISTTHYLYRLSP